MGILLRHKNSIFGLSADLLALSTSISDEAAARAAADGDLATLTTTDKTSLVGAINEALGVASTASAESLKIANNLSDVADVPTARTNLDVLSSTEVTDAINAAQLALGTSFDVANLVERDALTGLSINDRVYVADDGDTKWALYKPTAVDVNGTGTAWIKLMDQDVLETAISAASIKASYESNPDTNAYTDAAKAKVDLISVTAAIDLDTVITTASLIQDLAVSAPVDAAPSAAAAKAYAEEAARLGGSTSIVESITVLAGEVTLTYAPKGALGGVMNFSTVRYTDVNGVSYDAPLVATATPNVFAVSTDVAGEWDGNTVQVQYLYVPVA